jgi:ketosteroid isomerase-like protein
MLGRGSAAASKLGRYEPDVVPGWATPLFPSLRDTGRAMSANLDLVRSIYADWERGDFSRDDWADPAIELVRPQSLDSDALKGREASSGGWREWLGAWRHFRAEAHDYRVLADGRVLVFGRMRGFPRLSGTRTDTETVNLFHIKDGKVVRLVLYRNRDRALAALGLAE